MGPPPGGQFFVRSPVAAAPRHEGVVMPTPVAKIMYGSSEVPASRTDGWPWEGHGIACARKGPGPVPSLVFLRKPGGRTITFAIPHVGVEACRVEPLKRSP